MSTARRRLIHEAERVNPVAPVHIWRSPPGAAVDMLIVAHLSTYSAIHEHASRSLPNETGGFLIGRVAYDARGICWHLEIEQAVPVEPASQNPTHFTFTWRDVDRIRTYREEQGKALLGWYHTHPDLPVFLSETDLERTHRVLFSEPFQIALVYDPVSSRAGYFFWEGAQKIDPSPAPWREFEIAVRDDAEVDEEPPADQAAAALPPAPAPAEESEAPTAPHRAVSAGSGEPGSGEPAAPTPAATASATTDRPPGTHSRLRLPPDDKTPDPPPVGSVGAAGVAATDFVLDDAPLLRLRSDPAPASQSVSAVRMRGWTYVLLAALLGLAGLLGLAYFWFVPRQGWQ